MASSLALANNFPSFNPEIDLDVTPDFLPLFDTEHPDYYTRNLAWYGGRGGMKSWQIARGLLLRGLKGNELILCAREFQNSIGDSVLKLLEEQMYMMGIQDLYEVQRNSIISKINKTRFIFKGLKRNINSIKSTEGITICWVEEAQVVCQDSWDILTPTIRMENSQIIASFNPYLEADPTYVRYVADPIPNLFIRKVNHDSNPFFPEVLRKEMAWDKNHDNEKYLHIWEGVPLKRLESLVFKNYRIDGNIGPGEKDIIRFGADFGFSNDPSTLLRVWVDDEKREIYVDYEAYGVGIEIDHMPGVYGKIPQSKKWLITADCARPETISFLKRKGFKVKGTKKGKGSVEEGVEFLKSYTIIVHPRCKELIAELGLYCYKTDPMTGEILPVLVDKDNHCIDALRYALEALVFRKAMIHI